MSRDSMVSLILVLRVKVNDVASADPAVARIWTDDELQTYLDMHRFHVIREPLVSDSNRLVYYSAHGMFESDVSLWDSNGSGGVEIPNSDYVANLVDGIFTFTSESDYYLDGKSYNLHGAIAECLEQLAMDPLKAKSWNRGSVSYTHYDLMEMAKYHRNLMGMRSTGILRTYK